MFPVLAGSNPSGYNLTRSLRFRASASAYLNRTFGTPTNQAKWTWSAWVKLGLNTAGGSNFLFSGNTGSTDTTSFSLIWNQYLYMNGTSTSFRQTNAVYRDPSAWYHVVLAVDTTQSTEANKLLLWVNNVGQTYSVTNAITTCGLNASSATVNIGRYSVGASSYFDGYIAEQNFIDGQALTPSSFGSTNALTGVWQPARYAGTYGTNGFYLPFTDNSALTTSSNVGLGKDFSGNGNYWTTNNISITAGVTYDSMTDVPTLTSATAANYCTWNPLLNSSYTTLSNGNLTGFGNTSTDSGLNVGTIGVSSGKWYWEITVQSLNSTSTAFPGLGFLCNIPANGNAIEPAASTTLGLKYRPNGNITKNSAVVVGAYATFTTNDIISFALDVGNLTCNVYKNNTLQTTVTGLTLNNQFFAASAAYDGSNQSANFGQRPFAYTPPTGYVALNTYNLPTSTIVKGNTVMDATTYTGTLLSNAVTNSASFKPDLVWLKSRSAATDNELTDSVRGVTKSITSNSTAAEATDVQGLTAFNTNGFTVGTNTNYNNLAATYVAWQWQAGQGSTSSNTSGTITSTVSVNASAGFSVVTYTGTGANATVGHGLGVAPNLIIVKRRDAVDIWCVYTSTTGAGNYLALQSTIASTANTAVWNNTAPTSSVFSVAGSAATNNTGGTYVAYCWTPIAGYSAFGSYTGNGSTDGPFVYTGFRPKFVLIKMTSSTGDWYLYDSSRDPYNATQQGLSPNSSASETTYTGWGDLLSNGFKIRRTDAAWNSSGGTYIYMAFAENPTKYALAR